MKRLYIVFLTLTIGMVHLVYAQDQSYSMPQIIITSPVPSGTPESVVVPAYYNNCFVVPAGYYNNVWVAERTVCQYNANKAASYEAGYWRCTQHDIDGYCTYWDWISPHWSGAESIY